jgi:hypothetical protein
MAIRLSEEKDKGEPEYTYRFYCVKSYLTEVVTRLARAARNALVLGGSLRSHREKHSSLASKARDPPSKF